MRLRSVPTGLLLSLFLASIGSAQVTWSSLDEALARARAERNVILVDIRGCPPVKEKESAPRCHGINTQAFARAEASPVVRNAYNAFIRARVDVSAESSEAVARLIAQNPPYPSFVIIDPALTLIVSWRLDDASIHLNNLNHARKQIRAMLHAHDVRMRGEGAQADVLIGDINLAMAHAVRARRFYDSAITAFEAAGQPERARLTRIRVENVKHLLGGHRAALAEADRLMRGISPAVAVEGYLILGEMYAREKSHALAVDAYRSALEVAAPGSAHSQTARRALLRLGETTDLPAAASTSSMRIIGAARTSISGRAEFSAIAPPGTAQVLWYVDGEHVATASAPPFTALLRFGNTPRPYQLRAVAQDANNKGIARATMILNDRLDQPRIFIASPVESTVSGSVSLEAEAYVPPTMSLGSVEFFWNDERIASFTQPPFKAEFLAPEVFGYFRAQLTLADGQVADDAVVLNASGFGETVEVHTIAFAATVFDDKGKHLTKLNPNDFRAFDQNSVVALKLRDPGSEPATVGVTLDVSSSMSALLLPEIDMVMSLIDVIVPSERMFITAFDSQPRLLQPATKDREALRSRLFDLVAEGSSAVADALAFSIQQFSGLSGRRALVLITDGHENASEQNVRDCMNLARQSGVPLYVIVPKGAAEGAVEFRKVLKDMAEVTGGLLFNEPAAEQIPQILNRIREDVRAQYLLAFDATGANVPGTWRKVRVEIPSRRATVRTIGGYYTR